MMHEMCMLFIIAGLLSWFISLFDIRTQANIKVGAHFTGCCIEMQIEMIPIPGEKNQKCSTINNLLTTWQ